MIIPDLNILVYAANSSSQHHAAAYTWWQGQLDADGEVGLSWLVVFGFVRLVTSSRALENPRPVADAWNAVDTWLSYPGVSVLDPGPGHIRIVRSLMEPLAVGGKLVTDAHLAALAIEHHATLATNDRDFQRFPGLRHFNPLD